LSLRKNTNHALYFNGITDSIVIPKASFTRTYVDVPGGKSSLSVVGESAHGYKTSQHELRHRQLVVSAWIRPDCGGVILSQDGVFEFKVGSVEQPGPAKLVVETVDGTLEHLTTASQDSDASPTRWSGLVFPRHGADIHGSYNTYTSSTDATGLNINHRELLHVVAVMQSQQLAIYINGNLVAKKTFAADARMLLRDNAGDFHIGGKGGEFRGTIEQIRLYSRFTDNILSPVSPPESTNLIAQYRFEEPVDVHQTIYQSGAFSAASDGTTKTITIPAASAQAILASITGKAYDASTNSQINLIDTSGPYSSGNYEVADYVSTPGTAGTLLIPHTPYNILFNPDGLNPLNKTPNAKPPERLRLLSVNGTSGVIGVESIHLDFGIGGARRGVLHSRTANTDDHFVLVVGDILLDSGTGKPYQPPHYGSQVVDRTGQMVLNEAIGSHGLVYSKRMATTATDPKNPFAAVWPASLDTGFQIGHTARHCVMAVKGHSALSVLPPANEEIVHQSTDGSADLSEFYYDFSSRTEVQSVPLQSRVDMYQHVCNAPVAKFTAGSFAFQMVSNGLSAGNGREMLAIGGLSTSDKVLTSVLLGEPITEREFDCLPFLLKGPYPSNLKGTTDAIRKSHLRPISESRIAVLAVPTLADDNMAPFIHVYYNAIDITGASMGLTAPCLIVEKTVPSLDITLPVSGNRLYDVVASDLANAAKETFLYSPGGVLEFREIHSGNHPAGLIESIESSGHEGSDFEDELDESRTPVNYTPLTSTDPPNRGPQVIAAQHTDSTKTSVFHLLEMTPDTISGNNYGERTEYGVYNLQPFVSNTGAGVFDIADPDISSHLYETFDIIAGELGPLANRKLKETSKIVIQPTDRSRTTQLLKVWPVGENLSTMDISTTFRISNLVSKMRVQSYSDSDGEDSLVMTCVGLTEDASSKTVDFIGSGAPDSHVVKEVMPGSPVVTVTLGGPGQGAINTKPTYDPSPFTRLGWNTRRDCAVQISATASTTLTVIPLNNDSSDLASWGTYCFPKVGRVYLENGASALYASKSGTVFTFSGSSAGGTAAFLNGNGTESDTFADWVANNGVVAGTLLFVDGEFGESSVCNDGSTINDRMFQRMDSVSHDYQLGTQYAGTRALVEIPLFPNLFFENKEACISPGPDNSLKIHVDCTYTAHTWAPNPVGRRCDDNTPTDRTIYGAHANNKGQNALRKGTHIKQLFRIDTHGYLAVEEGGMFETSTTTAAALNNYTDTGATASARPGAVIYQRAFLPNGEWILYSSISGNDLIVDDDLLDQCMSENFLATHEVGMALYPGPGVFDENFPAIRNHPTILSAAYEGRRPYYYDRANVQTQGGNIDYGLRQYVSAVEFKAGPRENPHLPRTKNRRARSTVISWSGTSLLLTDASDFPLTGMDDLYKVGGTYQYRYRVAYIDSSGTEQTAQYETINGNTLTIIASSKSGGWGPAAGDEVFIKDYRNISASAYPQVQEDVALNASWLHPYAAGGLRDGDTVWMNMHYTNPHAVEGLFCKSRGTFNEALVARHFNGGEGALANRPRDSIPMENFLIGNDCLETATNFVQHINKTIELNWAELGRDDSAPVVAFVDPYQATAGFARVLLYDTAHDREFIAMHDIHMQVQSSPATPKFGTPASYLVSGPAAFNGSPTSANHSTQLDVQNGQPSEDKSVAPTAASEFMEAAFSHDSEWNYRAATEAHGDHGHHPQAGGCVGDGSPPRTHEETCCPSSAVLKHRHFQALGEAVEAEYATFFDTPEGTRAIPAFLCLKGKRTETLDLTSHKEARLQHLSHWTQMDFVRRLTIDLGEVGVKEGVTDIQAAAQEVVRLINQAGAPKGRTHARRPANQYPSESARLGLEKVGIFQDGGHSKVLQGPRDNIKPSLIDASAPHLSADFSPTGSTHDPAPFWDIDKAFASHDRGSHMGYVRAHLGRVVEDAEGNGNEGFSIVIHSTVPGASGRNFCLWLDNSKGQSTYRPKFLIGHGGRFRNFWCRPDEVLMENMHPAPMPINKDGRPFAPITTLNEYLPPEEPEDVFMNNLNYGSKTDAAITNANNMGVSGYSKNTVYQDSYESQSPDSVLTQGLRLGTRAQARINFGGLVASGVPGFSPRAGPWGMGKEGNTRYLHAYGKNGTLTEVDYTTPDDTGVEKGHVPSAEIQDDAIGNQLYGLRLTDHLGRAHTLRFIYSEFGESFSYDNSTLPPTIDQEVCIWFDDRDCGSGGFTIGKHMWGIGEATGRLLETESMVGTATWVGNKWQPFPCPNVGIEIDNVSVSGTTVTIELPDPYHSGGTHSHDDILGYLGFPDAGVFQTSKPGTAAETGLTFSYTGRTHSSKSGTHKFYGVTGNTALPNGDSGLIISPRIGWTTLLTDEVIAAAVNFAINMDDPNSDSATTFDCTNMRAADGRTLGEWGVDAGAIRVRAHSQNHDITPLRCLFESSLSKDWGISGSTNAAIMSVNQLTAGERTACGYLPETVLHLRTKSRGTNANTATPILVDTMNNAVDVTTWRQNLRGARYVDKPGDYILPMIENRTALIDGDSTTIDTSSNPRTIKVGAASGTGYLWHMAIPASANADSWGERRRYWLNDKDWVIAESTRNATDPELFLMWKSRATGGAVSDNFEANIEAFETANNDCVISTYGSVADTIAFDGIRRSGNSYGEPLVYFRGGRDSPDHSVPVYFGGGFSGVVMDVNDGTQNDYSDFYTHPYSEGPTGSAGLQNIGEKSTSYCLVDCAAMLAMFPGTPYLDNHKGENNPPFYNQDGILSPDLDAGNNSRTGTTGMASDSDYGYGAGANITKVTIPSPVILRFAHSHSRYSHDASSSGKTTYIVFGPGQAFPHNNAAIQPNLGKDTVKTLSGAAGEFTPNTLTSGDVNGRHSGGTLTPPSANFQIGNAKGWNYVDNWEPAQGKPNVRSAASVHGYDQTPYDGLYYGSHFTSGSYAPPPYAHPFDYAPTSLIGSSLRHAGFIWHMDGGYHPGGHFLDRHVLINAPHYKDSGTVTHNGTAKSHPSAFRVSGLLAASYGATSAYSTEEFVIVDATRVQNAEELAAVLSCSINEWPGRDPLKAIGGTFLPSFQTGHKQDRYGWQAFTAMEMAGEGGNPDFYEQIGGSGTNYRLNLLNPYGADLPPLPRYGWLRVGIGGNDNGSGAARVASYSVGATAVYAPYHTMTVPNPGHLQVTLDVNRGGTKQLEESVVDTATAATASTVNAVKAEATVYIWTKAGAHIFNNGRTNSGANSQNHMCQVHFNGLMDAIDRTRAVGAIGWHGERYSYLNSLDLRNPDDASTAVYAAGLGAWHPYLGFSPYGASSTCQGSVIPVSRESGTMNYTYNSVCPQGLSPRHLVAVTYESELALIAKADRDGTKGVGDWLYAAQVKSGVSNTQEFGGTIAVADQVFNLDRYVAPANAGPNVEAQIVTGQTQPTNTASYNNVGTESHWHSRVTAASQMSLLTSCAVPTGDLFWDESSVYSNRLHADKNSLSVNCNVSGTTATPPDDLEPWNYWAARSPARNFTIEHIVWKRMDGGNLTMPACNARGLGAVPFTTRVSGVNAYTMGETIYGNCRFSFESTNSAMFPIIQAQELSHPQLAEQPVGSELQNVLTIPNEETQFESVEVMDDTGQIHVIEGGSPFGTIIRDFELVSDRSSEGLSPTLANSGLAPNMRIRLPDPDTIPGNIIVRSGFDRIQSYQNETLGSGGMMHPAQPVQGITDTFTDSAKGPRGWPTWENKGWEHISQDADDSSLTAGETRLAFPDQHSKGWDDHTDGNPLETAYEQHDRTLFFHVTKMGHTGSSRNPTAISSGSIVSDPLTFSSSGTNTVTAGSSPNAAVWKIDSEKTADGRWFARVEDATGQGALFSYTNISSANFTGVVFDPDFSTFISGKTGLVIKPSWYIPAGSNRFFAARRLRDHSEISGNSPDAKRLDWTETNPVTLLTKPKLTPMPIPRMGHHYVTPSMMVMPGHFSHPAYERAFNLHYGCRSSSKTAIDDDTSLAITNIPVRDPLVWFSTPSSALRPSDIHGGAFTLLTETKVAYDGYGIAASKGAAGTANAAGKHIIYLEAAGTYSLKPHFPDPIEVGAYQIIIQPNLHKQQFSGFHRNGAATALPDGSAVELTGQQVNLVIGLEHDAAGSTGAVGLLLAEATMADTRGCEIFINEVMLDLDPDPGSQFTNIPTLGLYNPIGVNENTSPPFSRRSLPYRPGTFERATPGYTLTVPWWAILHRSKPTSSIASGYVFNEWHKPDDYYQFCRATYGAVGCQITLAGYPSIYPDIYENHFRARSLNPHCVVLSLSSTNRTITVDNNELFPVDSFYGEVLEYIDNEGSRQTATYTHRTGTKSHSLEVGPTKFENVIAVTPAFWTKLAAAEILRLSRPYDTTPAGSIFQASTTSAITRVLPQTYHGSRDTNSLHQADAFLCLWHPNLGRPYTFYSDTGRTFYTNTGAADTPQDKKGLNHIPEHFETIHYHDFLYSISKGPFSFDMKGQAPASDGTAQNASDLTNHQGDGSRQYVGFWPGGSRGGPAGSRLDGYGYIKAGWGDNDYGMECTPYSYDTSTGGIDQLLLASINIGASKPSAGNTIVITSAAKTTKTYTAVSGSATITSNQFSVDNTNADVAESLLLAIKHASGHNGEIDVTRASGVLTLTDTPSEVKNQSLIVSNLANTTVTQFSGTHTLLSTLEHDRQYCFGYRFAVRPPFNRPRWSPGIRGIDEVEETAATASITFTGDPTTDRTIILISTDGTTKTYTAKNTAAFASNQFDANGGAAANATSLKGAVEHASGHNGKILVADDGAGTLTFTQNVAGSAGNTVIVSTLDNTTHTSFTGGHSSSAEYNMTGYSHGPFVAQDSRTQASGGWKENADAGLSGAADIVWNATNAGILERQTQATAMLGNDQTMRQVRYSHGRRMTRPFGCPTRTVRNASTVRKKYPGDDSGLGIDEIAEAHRFYLVDWWGNTRGEDVRRFPARGFGIRPAWDPEEAYTDDAYANLKPSATDLWHDDGASYKTEQEGTTNSTNNSDMTRVDWFNPKRAQRIGDRGDGRGMRWPTVFNESLLHDISEDLLPAGLVLSHSTAEPPFTTGYLRPANSAPASTEIPRGISARLGVAQDGLLKPEANVSEKVETVSGTFTIGGVTLADPMSRSAPRIGLDVETIEAISGGQETDHIAMSTQAHSLHTDKEVGQRLSLRGAFNAGSTTLTHFDLTTPTWATQPDAAVVRLSNAHAMWPLGGTYVLEVRNYAQPFDDSGWGQQMPLSGLALWLKSDSLDLAGGAAVTQWDDLSGNSRHFTQSTSSLQPSYVASDSDFNSKPVVNFDGSDKLALNFDAGLNTNEFTVFIVTAVSSDTDAIEAIIDSRSSSPVTRSGFNFYADMRNTGGNNNWEFWVGADSSWKALSASGDSASTSGVPSILVGQVSGGNGAGASATQLFRVDGVQVGTQSANFYKSTADASQLGTNATSSYQLNGDMAEIIQYNRALSTTEIEQVEAYLASKYGIGSTSTFKSWNPSNPYQDGPVVSSTAGTHNAVSGTQMNYFDKTVRFLLRPSRVLDNRHVEIFRADSVTKSSTPQDGNDAYRSTSGGKYGLFNYDMPNARTGTVTPVSPPYSPSYTIDSAAPTLSLSSGPNIPGADVSGYSVALDKTVARILITENTLEHFRSDAPRRRFYSTDADGSSITRRDYSVQPRHSQTLHAKGEEGTASYNTGDHSGE